MSLKNLSIVDFINEVDSEKPTPGGGSVSALASALGVALSSMVGHLTINKKVFFELTELEKNEYKYHFNLLAVIKDKLLILMDEDTLAFNKFIAALKLAKVSEGEINIRNKAIKLAKTETINVPLEIANLSCKALEIIARMVNYGNKNAISDIGVGTLLLYAGVEGAILNVKINLSDLNESDRNYYEEKCLEVINKSQKLKTEILTTVNKLLGGKNE